MDAYGYDNIGMIIVKGLILTFTILGLGVGAVVGGCVVLCCAVGGTVYYCHYRKNTDTTIEHSATASTDVELAEIPTEEIDLQGNAFTTVEV